VVEGKVVPEIITYLSASLTTLPTSLTTPNTNTSLTTLSLPTPNTNTNPSPNNPNLFLDPHLVSTSISNLNSNSNSNSKLSQFEVTHGNNGRRELGDQVQGMYRLYKTGVFFYDNWQAKNGGKSVTTTNPDGSTSTRQSIAANPTAFKNW